MKNLSDELERAEKAHALWGMETAAVRSIVCAFRAHPDTFDPAMAAQLVDEVVKSAVAAEREACAKIAEGCKPIGPTIGPLFTAGMCAAADHIAAAIRARGGVHEGA